MGLVCLVNVFFKALCLVWSVLESLWYMSFAMKELILVWIFFVLR